MSSSVVVIGSGRRRRGEVVAEFVVGVGVTGVSCGDDVGEAEVAEFAYLIEQATECVGSSLHPLSKQQAKHYVDAEAVMFTACSRILSEQR